MVEDYALFGWAAERYDIHTPPDHYRHDHGFVLEELRLPQGSRVLDVGCGTGVFLDRAKRSGLDVFGIDASESMVRVARRRVGEGRIRPCAMQAIDEEDAYDALVSLCWSFNYCESLGEALSILRLFARALRSGGRLVLQLAHAAHATGRLFEDREPGPGGGEDDVTFFYRFTALGGGEPALRADYVYACRSLDELVFETHRLGAADVHRVATLAEEAGFVAVTIYDSWRRDPLEGSVSPFLVARKGDVLGPRSSGEPVDEAED